MTARVDTQAAKERARVIREDVGQYQRGREAFTAVSVLSRWNLDYLLETADMLDALVGLLADAETERDGAKLRADAMQAEADARLRENERLTGLLADAEKALRDTREAQKVGNVEAAARIVIAALAAFDAGRGEQV